MTVAFVTCRDMPKPDLDEPALLDALARVNVEAERHAWDADVDWATFDLVVLRTPWDYVGRFDEFRTWMRRAADLTKVLNPPAIVEWNLHKRYLFDLEAAAVPIVPTRMVAQHGPFPYQRAALRRFEGEVVIKPAIGIGAFGAARLEAGTEEAFAHLEALAILGDVLIQPMIPSVAEHGEVSIIHLGGEYSHALRKVPAAGDFRVQDHHGGIIVDHAPSSAELAVAAEALLTATSETGLRPLYGRVDLVEMAGPVVMELELVEPELFLRLAPGSADRFAAAIAGALN